MSLSIALHNVTQEAEVLNVLHDFTVRTVVPATLLESFFFGACTAGILLGSYMIWSQSSQSASTSRVFVTLLLWSLYSILIAHWILSIQQLWELLSGRALGLPLTSSAVYEDSSASEEQSGNSTARVTAIDPELTFNGYAIAWSYLIPLVTETTLLGFATALLPVMLRTTILLKVRHQIWGSLTWVVPAVTAVMYAISISHWAVSLSLYNGAVKAAMNPTYSWSYSGGILRNTYYGIDNSIALFASACLAINIVFSDAIVLWRMCIVWDKARFTTILSVLLVSTTASLAIANLVELSGKGADGGTGNMLDSEILPAFGENSLGLAAAFLSLTSNICATCMVAWKAWLLRKDFAERSSSSGQNTTINRVMELLIDSGVAYTAIWLLYILSFFFDVTSYSPIRNDDTTDEDPVTAVTQLDAAMAQLTTIYPLMILLLIGINNAARRPRLIGEQDGTFAALTINMDPGMDIEGHKMLEHEMNDGHKWSGSRYSKDSTW